MVPKLLIPEQKESRMNICADNLTNIDTDPGLLDTVITCDASCFFIYDRKQSANPCIGRAQRTHQGKKARMSKSKFNAMTIVFLVDRYQQALILLNQPDTYITWRL
ncbi:hypothetical protein NQ318_001497 [Aromia moschata]|uniref:Uncharacterized protein n=1 Tax=Aromia moschata TaxID=1265417 RepID=A0AAV8Y9K1_9CUCU|nr:hypothetical protein NQ318_001497 [Aromia moschata]